LNLDIMPGSAGLIAVLRTYRIKTRSTCISTTRIKKTTPAINLRHVFSSENSS
jgi:hypothetical protein